MPAGVWDRDEDCDGELRLSGVEESECDAVRRSETGRVLQGVIGSVPSGRVRSRYREQEEEKNRSSDNNDSVSSVSSRYPTPPFPPSLLHYFTASFYDPQPDPPNPTTPPPPLHSPSPPSSSPFIPPQSTSPAPPLQRLPRYIPQITPPFSPAEPVARHILCAGGGEGFTFGKGVLAPVR